MRPEMKSKLIVSMTAGLMGVAMLFFPAIASAGARELQSLDGTWEIIFDAENQGREGGWHRDQAFSAQDGRRDIFVPSCWEEIE